MNKAIALDSLKTTHLLQDVRFGLKMLAKHRGFAAAAGAAGVPGGAAQHILLSRATTDALYLALADLVRDSFVTEPHAIEMGRGVRRDNARRLDCWIKKRTACHINDESSYTNRAEALLTDVAGQFGWR